MRSPDQDVTAMRISMLRTLARIIALAYVVIGSFALLSIFTPQAHRTNAPLPLVLPGAPFGTYAQSTSLGIGTLIAGFVVGVLGGFLTFLRERLAGWIFLASGALQAFLFAMWLPDRTAPPESHLMGLLVAVLPPIVAGTLLILVSRWRLRGLDLPVILAC